MAPFARRKKLLQRRRARLAVARGQQNLRIERQQRHREVAVGRGREEIAADRRHVAHRRPAHGARCRMQERQLGPRQDRRHGRAGADFDPSAARLDPRVGWIEQRTSVPSVSRPSLTSRITSVPPERRRALRSADRMPAASAMVRVLRTSTGMTLAFHQAAPCSSGRRRTASMPAA